MSERGMSFTQLGGERLGFCRLRTGSAISV